MRRFRSLLVGLAATVALAAGLPLAADASRGEPSKKQHACGAKVNPPAHLGCRDLVIDVASAYLESITTPGIDYLPELPGLLHDDAKRWINRNHNHQPPSNDGREEVLEGVIREPECSFENIQWVVEGNLERAWAVAIFDAVCVGFPSDPPPIVRDTFLIEDGRIKAIYVAYIQPQPAQ